MPQRGQQTTLQERVQIRDLAAAGYSDPEIAAVLTRPVATVRKWRRIAQRQTRPDLTSRFGRRTTGALSTFPAELQAHIRHLRETHRGWGADTILVELQRDARWQQQRLPSAARIAVFLKEAGLTRTYQKRHPVAQPPVDAPTQPHEEWQLDAQGAMTVAGVGTVSVINVVDVVSRVKVESYPDVGRTQPTMADYQLTLRRAFTSFGLPERITFDHGTSFIDHTSASPFPTLLHLWLIALGIVVLFTRKRRPTDHAVVERTHQTLAAQALVGQTYADGDALWAALDARREVLNTALPTRALGKQPPLTAYPEAVHSGRTYRPEWEGALLDLGRVDAYLAQGEWFRQTNCHGEFWLGQQRYSVGRKHAKQEVAVGYDPQTRELVARPGGGATALRFPIKGGSMADLMGELSLMLAGPGHQLALPFTREAARQYELAGEVHAMAA
jgi:hypothetical protein